MKKNRTLKGEVNIVWDRQSGEHYSQYIAHIDGEGLAISQTDSDCENDCIWLSFEDLEKLHKEVTFERRRIPLKGDYQVLEHEGIDFIDGEET